jgi:uncharacterized protein YvpB
LFFTVWPLQPLEPLGASTVSNQMPCPSGVQGCEVVRLPMALMMMLFSMSQVLQSA